MSSTGTSTGMPSLTAPIAAPNTGIIERVWYLFLQQVWTRTGGVTGGILGVQSGSLMDYCGDSAPDGYLACDGSAVSRSTYSQLFGAIGTTWGAGDGSTTFNVPDFRGKFLFGADGTHTVGSSGGTSTATLATVNLPAHNHPVIDPGHNHGVTDPQHNHAITDPGHSHTALAAASTNTAGILAGSGVAGNTGTSITGITVNNASTGVSVNTGTTGITTGNTGSGTAFPIIPPYAVVLKCIKT